MSDDHELLQEYAEERSQAAFAEIVRRHVNLVYAAARRQAGGDVHMAEDATQQVFTDLARKAGSLSRHRVLAGWLFTSTRYTVAKLVRTEQRRRAREVKAHLMNEPIAENGTAVDWERIRPVLDDALAALGTADREAVLLRFFEGRDFAELGARLSLTENTARMRVSRALEKLREQLNRRGVKSSAAVLATVLTNEAAMAAPATLAAGVTTQALTLATASAGMFGATAVHFMITNKLILGSVGAVLLAGSTTYLVQARTTRALEANLAVVQQDNQRVAELRAQNVSYQRESAELASMAMDPAQLTRLQVESASLRDRLARAQRLQAARADAGRFNAGKVFDPTSLDQMPKAVSLARPQYPQELRSSGVGGEVVVDFIVDANGQVRNAFAAKSSVRELEGPAVEAVSQWIFEPGRKGGRIVNTHMQVPVVFNVSSAPPTPKPEVVGGPAKEG